MSAPLATLTLGIHEARNRKLVPWNWKQVRAPPGMCVVRCCCLLLRTNAPFV
jgi:hypothetical protein